MKCFFPPVNTLVYSDLFTSSTFICNLQLDPPIIADVTFFQSVFILIRIKNLRQFFGHVWPQTVSLASAFSRRKRAKVFFPFFSKKDVNIAGNTPHPSVTWVILGTADPAGENGNWNHSFKLLAGTCKSLFKDTAICFG